MDSLSTKLKLAVDKIASKLSFRNAIGISVFFHIFIAVAFASVFVGRHLIAPESDKLIEFDLVTVKEVEVQKSTTSALPSLLDEIRATGSVQADLTQKAREGSNIAEVKPALNREAVIFASLASLSELRESFSFLEAELKVNSGSSWSPVDGDAPDVSGLAKGLSTGFGYGGRGIVIGGFRGGGGGDCPPRGN